MNTESIAFHERMGFTVHGPITDYNQPGTAHVVFERARTPELTAGFAGTGRQTPNPVTGDDGCGLGGVAGDEIRETETFPGAVKLFDDLGDGADQHVGRTEHDLGIVVEPLATASAVATRSFVISTYCTSALSSSCSRRSPAAARTIATLASI